MESLLMSSMSHADGKPNCMSIDDLQNALRRLHVGKAVADLAQEFKVVDLNGDGEIDFDEFQFAVKIRHGFGFGKNQYFISWTSAETISKKKMEEIGKMFAKELPHALRGKVHEIRAQRSLLPSLSFKGKSLETGLDPQERNDPFFFPFFLSLAGDEPVCGLYIYYIYTYILRLFLNIFPMPHFNFQSCNMALPRCEVLL